MTSVELLYEETGQTCALTQRNKGKIRVGELVLIGDGREGVRNMAMENTLKIFRKAIKDSILLHKAAYAFSIC